jgi:hypothetical protein
MKRRSLFFIAPFAFLACTIHLNAQNPAPTPPMGWNSWDAYGLTIDEADFKANVKVLSGLKQYGWEYAVIDEGWYMQDPFASKLESRKYVFDGNGIQIPAANRFPSAANGAGFMPLADWVHAQGLKFGIHIVRGIPKQVVRENLPIAGSSFHAAEAGDTSDTCPWDDGNYGVQDNAAGQAYYDSMMMKYARWGLDYIKVDCIGAHPYRPTEIKQIASAIRKTRRPIVLSLSPGPMQLENAAEVAEYAQMWRISDDHWDGWTFPHKPNDGEFPFGVRDAFDRLAKWFPNVAPGNWPDEDMLPEGWLGPHPGWGEPRQSRLTQDEQRTEFTLWAIARSPLILGTNLTKLDDFTKSLITNSTILFMNQNVTYSRPLDAANLPVGFENARVWRATIDAPGARNYAEFLAFFNLDEKPVSLHASWKQLGLEGRKHMVQDAWKEDTGRESTGINVILPTHGSAIYRIQ